MEIVDMLANEPAELVRRDNRFKELDLDAASYVTKEAVVDLLFQHPELMQRPVATYDGAAMICRPPELILDLLGNNK